MLSREFYLEGNEDFPALTFEDGVLVLRGWRSDASPPLFRLDPRDRNWRSPAYLYAEIKEAFRANELKMEDQACGFSTAGLEFRIRQDLFPHQEEALQAWEDRKHRGSVVLPTGTGKTVVGLQAMAALDTSTLVVCPTLDLMNQWYDRITDAFGIETGILGGGFHEIRAVTVTTYDSAFRHLDRYGGCFGLLIFDETHHLAAPTYLQIPELSIAPYRLGLTATYRRPDARHVELARVLGPVVYEKRIRDLKGERLSEYEIVRIPVRLADGERALYERNQAVYAGYVKENQVRYFAGGWEKFIRESAGKPEARKALLARTEMRRVFHRAQAKYDILESLFKRHVRDRVIVFTEDNALAYDLASHFLIPALTHHTDTRERKAVLDRFRSGEYRFLVTSKVLNEGVDVPEANVAVILGGSASPVEHVQRLGRILRKKSGKRAILYEVVVQGTAEGNVSYRRRGSDAYR
jgi:superfamily II DNA or RNA helicase